MSTLITNIGELVTNAPGQDEPGRDEPGQDEPGQEPGQDAGAGPFATLGDAALVMDAGLVAWTGPASRAPAADEIVDARGRAVLPGFVDSHAHLVFAGERGAEFAARMAGAPYRAGGISVNRGRDQAGHRPELRGGPAPPRRRDAPPGHHHVRVQVRATASPSPTRRAASELAAEVTPEVTYLGAHVVPPEFDGDPGGYVDLVCGPMLDACAPHARWVDVFCERGAFGADEAAAVLAAGRASGLIPRVHANQLGPGPRRAGGGAAGAASADHCTHLTDADVDALAGSPTVATLLPGVEFSTRQPYPDARRLLGAGVTVALATDCNPGSCFTSSMALCVALAVREMRMTTAEAVWAATAGGARALRRTDVGPPRRGRPRRRAACWTRRRTPTWPTGRACRWRPRSGARASWWRVRPL